MCEPPKIIPIVIDMGRSGEGSPLDRLECVDMRAIYRHGAMLSLKGWMRRGQLPAKVWVVTIVCVSAEEAEGLEERILSPECPAVACCPAIRGIIAMRRESAQSIGIALEEAILVLASQGIRATVVEEQGDFVLYHCHPAP